MIQKEGNKKLMRNIFLALLVGAGLYFLPSVVWRPVQSVLQVALKPFVGIAESAGYTLHSGGELIFSLGSLKEENRNLQREVLRLKAEVAERQQAANENEELRRNLQLLESNPQNYIAATVIGRDAAGTNNTFVINKGTNAGVQIGRAVVVEKGVLIGRVTAVTPYTATIMLITNEESVVNAETTEGSVRGVARGDHGLLVRLDMVEQNKELKEESGVVTSGLGGEYPKGLLIGTLTEVRLSEDKLFQQARIRMPVDLNAVRFVFVYP